MSGMRYRVAVAVATTAALLGPVGAAPARSADAPAQVVTTRQAIGTSVEGRTIWAVHRYRPGATRRVVVIGQVHGDERAGVTVARMLQRLDPPAQLDLWIVPTANPDGLAARTRTNARKVDLNRNFPYRWKRVNVGRPTYSGPAAVSEPETRVLRAFITKVDPRLTVTFHQPLFGVGRNDKRPAVAAAMARATGLPLETYSCSGVCNGSFTSWHNRYRTGVAVTVEFGRTVTDARLRRAAAAVLSVGARY
jgi:predicted deacylase